MGYASYFEHTIEKITENLALAESAVQTGSFSGPEWVDRLKELISTCRALLWDISEYSDLATDPQIDLAYELSVARSQCAYLTSRLGEYERATKELAETRERCSQLETELIRLKIQYGGKCADVKEMDRKFKRMKKILSRSFRSH